MTFTPEPRFILASSSEIRATLLRNAGLSIQIQPAKIDEDAIRQAMIVEGASPRDLADVLAERKAVKISDKWPGILVLGSDQILEHGGKVFSKPGSPSEARAQLLELRGSQHRLYSAVVVCLDGQPIWRHVGTVRLTLRDFSEVYLDNYLDPNWQSIRQSVGCYKLEQEGVRLFSRIEGDYFNVLGLPLIELLTWLGIRGEIET